MKNYIFLFILLACTTSQAQNVRTYIPFKYENKWGLVDSSATEVVQPQFKSMTIFEDFGYVAFDDKAIYNLKTGAYYPSFGEYNSTIRIEDVNYYLFTNKEKSILINFERKDSIPLSLRYMRMTAIDFYDLEANKTNTIIAGYLYDNKVIFLRNEKKLPAFISHRFNENDIETIEKSRRNTIGLVVRKEGYLYFYDHKLRVIKKIKNPNKTGYRLLTEYLKKQLSTFYKFNKINTGCFSCIGAWDSSWDLKNELSKNTLANPDRSTFYLSYDKNRYYLNSATDADLKLVVRPNYFYYPDKYKSIQIEESKSLFFYDAEYMPAEKIMFPEKYLK